jgi:hypothetical protein
MPFEFRQQKLVVCEGKTDKRFFDALLRARGINGFDVFYPIIDEERDEGGGIDKVGAHLKRIGVQEDFIQTVRSIVVVGDNDNANALDRACTQVSEAGYTRPSAVAGMVRTKGRPNLAILLLPQQHPGCLETLCQQAADTKWPNLIRPLQTFMQASPCVAWSVTKQAKTAVECILAVTCEKQPEVVLGNIWQKNKTYQIPLDAPVFDFIETFLRGI